MVQLRVGFAFAFPFPFPFSFSLYHRRPHSLRSDKGKPHTPAPLALLEEAGGVGELQLRGEWLAAMTCGVIV